MIMINFLGSILPHKKNNLFNEFFYNLFSPVSVEKFQNYNQIKDSNEKIKQKNFSNPNKLKLVNL